MFRRNAFQKGETGTIIAKWMCKRFLVFLQNFVSVDDAIDGTDGVDNVFKRSV